MLGSDTGCCRTSAGVVDEDKAVAGASVGLVAGSGAGAGVGDGVGTGLGSRNGVTASANCGLPRSPTSRSI